MNLLPKKLKIKLNEDTVGLDGFKKGWNDYADAARLSLVKGLKNAIDKATKHLRIVATIGAPGGLKIEGKEKFKKAIIKSIKETK